jgi:hypothetical protein
MPVATKDNRAQEIANLTREAVIERLLRFKGRVRLDFTPEFLGRQSTEHLKHILLAATKHLT